MKISSGLVRNTYLHPVLVILWLLCLAPRIDDDITGQLCLLFTRDDMNVLVPQFHT